MLGKHHTKETREILSKKHQTKNIIMYDSAKKLVKLFDYINDAVEYLKETGKCEQTTKHESIRTRILKSITTQKNAYGYFWGIQQESVTTTETTTK